MTDVASIESVFERNPDSKGTDAKRFKIQNPSERMHPTKPKLQRTADKVLRLLSAHMSFAVDVR